MDWFEEPNLAKTFYEMIQAEQDLELLKQKLSLQTDFNMIDLWALFDGQGHGTISRMQFEEVYNLLSMYPDRHELVMLFRKFDTDQDEILKYPDLVNMFGPRDDRYKDVLVHRKSFNSGRCYMRAQCFLPETMNDFKRLLLLLLNTEVRINNLKKQLIERKNFDV